MKKFLAQELIRIEPNFSVFEEAEMFGSTGRSLGWHSHSLDQSGQAIGGGFHRTRAGARRRAVAETVERAAFRRLNSSPERAEVRLHEFTSTCGFAAGFHRGFTEGRAVCEAVERWAWSKWIDGGCPLPEVFPDRTELAPSVKAFVDEFDSVRYIQADLLAVFKDRVIPFRINIFLGFKDGGIFPGSRVMVGSRDGWEHAAIEAWRHLKIFRTKVNAVLDEEDIVDGRIVYFGKNAAAALKQIPSPKLEKWPMANVRLIKSLKFPAGNYYVARALADNYVSWHLGGVDRFVY